MKYYKVQEEKNYWKGNKYLGVACKDELLTEKEMNKIGFPFSSNFVPVEIKKSKTFHFFGCRFEMK